MTFRVEIARRAALEIEDQYEWLAERSPVSADRWRDSLLAAVSCLGGARRSPLSPPHWRVTRRNTRTFISITCGFAAATAATRHAQGVPTSIVSTNKKVPSSRHGSGARCGTGLRVTEGHGEWPAS
jgi:plasmid stabilization system protein ParE